MRQVHVRITKNPFFALSFGYEDPGLKGKRPFGFIFQEKDRLPEIRLKNGLLDNRIERSKAQALKTKSNRETN